MTISVISGHKDFNSLYASNDTVQQSFTVNILGAPNDSTTTVRYFKNVLIYLYKCLTLVRLWQHQLSVLQPGDKYSEKRPIFVWLMVVVVNKRWTMEIYVLYPCLVFIALFIGDSILHIYCIYTGEFYILHTFFLIYKM